MKIIRLEEANNLIFEQICLWYYNWLGIKNGESLEEVRYTFKHSLNKDKLPQTYVALIDEKPVGMYQLAIFDDLNCRPDFYPWLINVYVCENFRGNNVCRKMMETVNDNAKKANCNSIYAVHESSQTAK